MQIIHNQKSFLTITSIQKDKKTNDSLPSVERDLLSDLSGAFSIVHGGQFKKRRQLA